MAITSANQLELLQTAEAVAREKMIDPALVVEAMEDSLARAAKSRYGADMDIRVSRSTARRGARVRTVVTRRAAHRLSATTISCRPRQAQLTIDQARPHLDDPRPGDEIRDEVPPVEMGRIAAQSAKQVILQKVREAERDRQYEEFKDRAGTIINGIVKREEYGNVIVDVGRGEAMLRRNEKIGRESYRNGDRIRCYIKDVRREARGPQIFLSRTARSSWPSCSRWKCRKSTTASSTSRPSPAIPGSRAKIGVISHDNSIDPVGACVGMRGSRVQAVVNELQGEKIDIIPWNEDQATFLVNALQPAEVAKVVIDEEAQSIDVVVPEDQLSLAIGRRGQNVRLASAAHRTRHRHHDRGRGFRAPPEGVRGTLQPVHGGARPRRVLRPASRRRRLHQPRGGRLCRARRASGDRRGRRGHRRRASGARPRRARRAGRARRWRRRARWGRGQPH